MACLVLLFWPHCRADLYVSSASHTRNPPGIMYQHSMLCMYSVCLHMHVDTPDSALLPLSVLISMAMAMAYSTCA